jgi:hypothetical protein
VFIAIVFSSPPTFRRVRLAICLYAEYVLAHVALCVGAPQVDVFMMGAIQRGHP